ncbi:MAG: S9 family peptidase [Erysipelotrichaceae bacterium]|nr:S9 family peptidase [Erysipelotrichaceae bacterium]
MKSIKLDLFKKFTFLSSLSIDKNKENLYFIKTKVDEKNDGYLQQISSIALKSGKVSEVTDWKKRAGYFTLNDGIFVVDTPEDQKNMTVLKKATAKGLEEGFTLPLPAGRILDFDKDNFLVSTQINRSCPDYLTLSKEEQEAFDKQKKENNDYIVFDEYPFVFNGEGIINGNRTTLYLVSKKTGKAKRIVPETFDVSSFEIINGKLIFSANDFTTFKTKWDKIYQYNKSNGSITCLYDKKMAISRVFEHDKKIYVRGTFALDFGEMEAGKIYELKKGEMELRIDTDFSLYNSVGTDSKYGRGKAYDLVDGDSYFLNTDEDHSVLLKMEEDGFSKVLELGKGNINDFVVCKDRYYVIAMLGQQLEEVYEVKNGKAKALTDFNTAIFANTYVAKPEKLTVKRAVPIDGWVLKPANYNPSKKYPAILDIHGGPKTAYGEIYYHEMQYWAGQGYFVMFCNPRGSDGKGNAFADLRHQFGGIDYSDIMRFVDLVLETYPAIDPERLGVTGGSYGGYMTNWIIGQTNRFKAAATQRSISNWITEVGVSDYGIDFPIEQEFGDLFNCTDELWSMSPLKFAYRATTPTLFIHSTEDYRCPVPEALQLYTALTCKGVETRMVLFKGENHELSRSGKPSHRVRRLEEISNWMNKHLK